jgi:hypothetical protein
MKYYIYSSSCQSTDEKNFKCREFCANRENKCAINSYSKLLKSRPGSSPAVSSDINKKYIKCRCRNKEKTDNDNCTCFEDKMQMTVSFEKVLINEDCFSIEADNGSTREKCSSSLNEVQYKPKKSRG